MGSSHFVFAIDMSVRMHIQASRSVPAESPPPWKPLNMLSVSYSIVMMPKHGKIREDLKRNKKRLTSLGRGEACCMCARGAMGCVGVCIAAAASARPSARTSRVQVWFGLHLRLGWEASHKCGSSELSP
jgi:hypothetical protein